MCGGGTRTAHRNKQRERERMGGGTAERERESAESHGGREDTRRMRAKNRDLETDPQRGPKGARAREGGNPLKAAGRGPGRRDASKHILTKTFAQAHRHTRHPDTGKSRAGR